MYLTGVNFLNLATPTIFFHQWILLNKALKLKAFSHTAHILTCNMIEDVTGSASNRCSL